MKTFKEYLRLKDPDLYNEILTPLAIGLGVGAAGLVAPRATGRALKYVAKKGVDVAAGTAGHLINKGIDLGGDVIQGGARLAGKGLYRGAMAVGRGIRKGVGRSFEKPSSSQQKAPESQGSVGGTWYA